MSTKFYEGVRAVTVPGITAPTPQDIITAPCRLCGWSLFGGNTTSLETQGSAVAPAALSILAQIAGVPAGEYRVQWSVSLLGAAAAADQNNVRLRVGGTAVAVANMPGAAGNYPQQDVTIVVAAGGQTVSLQVIGAGTAGVTYDGSFSLVTGPLVQAQITDRGQLLGVSAMDAGKSDTQWLADYGVYVSTALGVTALAGTVSGVLYVRDYRDVPRDTEYAQG